MEQKFYELMGEYYAIHPRQKPPTAEEYQAMIDEITTAKSKKDAKSSHEYYLLRRYEVITIGNIARIVLKKGLKPEGGDDKFVYVPSYEQLFQVIQKAHLNCGHGGIRNTEKAALSHDVSRAAVEIFVKCCEQCALEVICLAVKVHFIPKPLSVDLCRYGMAVCCPKFSVNRIRNKKSSPLKLEKLMWTYFRSHVKELVSWLNLSRQRTSTAVARSIWSTCRACRMGSTSGCLCTKITLRSSLCCVP